MSILNMKLKSFKKIIESEKPYVIKFTYPNCHLCVQLKPVFHRIAKEHGEKFMFGNVNIRTNPELSDLFVEDGVPTIYIIDKEKLFEIPDPQETGYDYDYLNNYLTNLGY